MSRNLRARCQQNLRPWRIRRARSEDCPKISHVWHQALALKGHASWQWTLQGSPEEQQQSVQQQLEAKFLKKKKATTAARKLLLNPALSPSPSSRPTQPSLFGLTISLSVTRAQQPGPQQSNVNDDKRQAVLSYLRRFRWPFCLVAEAGEGSSKELVGCIPLFLAQLLGELLPPSSCPCPRSRHLHPAVSHSLASPTIAADTSSLSRNVLQVVGYILLSLAQPQALMPPPFPTSAPRRFYVEAIAILPQYQRRGMGSALLAAAEKLGRRLGHPSIWLHVSSTNKSAQSMYLNLGYTINTITGAWPLQRQYLMQKPLHALSLHQVHKQDLDISIKQDQLCAQDNDTDVGRDVAPQIASRAKRQAVEGVSTSGVVAGSRCPSRQGGSSATTVEMTRDSPRMALSEVMSRGAEMMNIDKARKGGELQLCTSSQASMGSEEGDEGMRMQEAMRVQELRGVEECVCSVSNGGSLLSQSTSVTRTSSGASPCCSASDTSSPANQTVLHMDRRATVDSEQGRERPAQKSRPAVYMWSQERTMND